MEGPGGGEVLDVGRVRAARRWPTVTAVLAAAALVTTGAVLGTTAWLARDPTSTELAVVDLVVTGSRPVTITAEPPVGDLATPAGASLPGIDVRARVAGDPSRAVQVTTTPTSTPVTDATAVYVAPVTPTDIAAGRFAEIDLTIAPVDCTAARAPVDPATALIVTTEGAVIPLSAAARESLATALAAACEPAGDPPELTVISARSGRAPALESIGLMVDVTARADRLVLTPLDSPGLRGLGSADRRDGARIPLLWLITPEAAGEMPTSFTQVYVVRADTAYPWIVGIPLAEFIGPSQD
jgi:hypothetical protein